MASTSVWLGGGILVAAGVYQWLPLKNACLAHCRSPLHFLGTEWREGGLGAVVMGVRHGSFCVGCCWALMALLFTVGVMNLIWVAGLTIFVLVEKTTGAGEGIGHAAGVGLVAWGLWVVVAGT
jgi:predicted metal-binding membrane protein